METENTRLLGEMKSAGSVRGMRVVYQPGAALRGQEGPTS